MSELLTLKGTNGVSEIHIESGLLARAASVIGETFSPSRIHIVSDSTVAPLYLEQLEQQFTLPVTHTVIPAGEEHKRLSTVEGIYHDLLANGMTRKDLIIALGGGGSTKLISPAGGRNIRFFAPKYPAEYISGIQKTCSDKQGIIDFYSKESKK